MSEPERVHQMREDWNRRAREDAYYYVAFAKRDQDDEGFFATASDVVRSLERELRRAPAREGGRRALEIGCGPARLMRPLGRHFAEIHGVDVSDEMVRRARANLADVPHASVWQNDGARLDRFAGGYFDFVYSYAVFQHIPIRDVVFTYLREAARVLAPGGVFRFQANSLPYDPANCDTWHGVSITPREVSSFARDNGLQLLAMEGINSQYMWVTLRRPAAPPGAQSSEARLAPAHVSNPQTGESLVPCSGRFATVCVWFRDFPDEVDLNDLEATVDDLPARPYCIGPPEVDGYRQVNVELPQGVGTGLRPMQFRVRGRPAEPTIWIRLIPPGPWVPELRSVTDSVNVLCGPRIVSGAVRLSIEELSHPERLRIAMDGVPVAKFAITCVDPVAAHYEVSFPCPAGLAPGRHAVQAEIGTRRLPPVWVEVEPAS